MKCSDVSNYLVDFLYEEMPAAERREFLAHVDGCTSCSSEVRAMASTLGHARAALHGPLAEEPPARVRARVLEAAQAAVAVHASRVGSPPAVPAAHHRGRVWEPFEGSHVKGAKLRAARVPQPEGFFARLWKTPWLVPALGAVGVATVVLLVRVIKNPQVFPEEKPAATEMLAHPAAQPPVLPRAQPQSEAEGRPAFPSPPALAKQEAAESDDNSYAERQHAAGKPRAATHAPSKLGKGGRRFAELSNEPLAGAGEDLARTPVGAATTAKEGFQTAARGKAPTAAMATRQPAQATHVEKDETSHATKSLAEERSGAIGAGAGSSARWAEPPPPRPAAAPAVFAAAPAPAESAPAKKTRPAPALDDLDLMKGAPQEQRRSPERAKAQAPVPPASPAAQTEAPADTKQVSQNKATISLAERARKAEKLFAEKKWAEAAAAFRALIAQAPSDPAAKTWRERLAAAEGAQEKGRAARAKASPTNDTLDGR